MVSTALGSVGELQPVVMIVAATREIEAILENVAISFDYHTAVRFPP
jgi:hypothetical protein